jgi:hypothetical protein
MDPGRLTGLQYSAAHYHGTASIPELLSLLFSRPPSNLQYSIRQHGIRPRQAPNSQTGSPMYYSSHATTRPPTEHVINSPHGPGAFGTRVMAGTSNEWPEKPVWEFHLAREETTLIISPPRNDQT